MKEYMNALLLGVSSLFILLYFAVLKPTNGDTYVYARSISTFEGPVFHYGYFLLGHLFHGVLKTFGNTPLMTLGYMSSLFGSLSVSGMYLFSLKLTRDRFRSLLAAAVLLFSGDFWLFSEHGEVYVPQFFFVLLSALLILHRKPLISVISLLVAISITPTSCLAVPGLLYLLHLEKYRKREVMFFLIPLVLVGIVVVWKASQIMAIINFGMYPPKLLLKKYSLIAILLRVVSDLVKVYGKSFNIFSFMALYGFARLFREDKRTWLLMIAFTLPFSIYILNLGLFSGDHLIITFIPISFLAAFGILHLVGSGKGFRGVGALVVVCLVSFHAWTSYQLFVRPEIRYSSELERVCAALAEEYKPDGIMLSKYNFGMAFWYLTQDEKDYSLLIGRPRRFLQSSAATGDAQSKRLEKKYWVNIGNPIKDGFPEKNEKLMRGRPLYFVDTVDWPTSLVKLVLPSGSLEKRRLEITSMKRVRRFFEIRFGDEVRIEKIIDSPLFPVYRVNLE